MPAKGGNSRGKSSEYKDKDKPTQIRYSNITAAKGMTATCFSGKSTKETHKNTQTRNVYQ